MHVRLRESWKGCSHWHRRLLGISLAAASSCLVLAACTSGDANEDAAIPSTQTRAASPDPAATPAPTSAPRRTPSGSSGSGNDDDSPGLIAVYAYVEVSEGQLTLDKTEMAAEEVYFNVTFSGDEEHRISVVRWDGDPAALPVSASDEVVAGSQLVGSLPRTEPGNTEIFEIEPIAPGKYVILCNEPGHYKRGEYAAFAVTAPR